jgi:hypothetical protein
MKAALDTTGKVWTPIVINVTLETEEEYMALLNTYSVHQLISIDDAFKERDKKVVSKLLKHLVEAISK